MNYTQDPELLVLASITQQGEDLGAVTAHRRSSVFRELLKDGERKSFDMVHFTYHDLTSVYAALEIASRFTGTSDVHLTGDTPENEGFYRNDGSGLFHEDSVDMEEHSSRTRDALNEVVISMISAGVNTGQAFEQGAMTSGASIYTRGSVLDYYGLYTQMTKRTHPAVVKYAQDAWADLRARHPALTEAIKEAYTP